MITVFTDNLYRKIRFLRHCREVLAVAGLAAVLDVVVRPGHHEKKPGNALLVRLPREVLILDVFSLPASEEQ